MRTVGEMEEGATAKGTFRSNDGHHGMRATMEEHRRRFDPQSQSGQSASLTGPVPAADWRLWNERVLRCLLWNPIH